MSNKVVICGVDTSLLPKITAAESRKLLLEISKGDKTARTKFIISNLRLVLSIVQRYSQRAKNMDDLFQVGCVGLVKSVDNFDVTLNVCFSTYAVPMIVGEIRRYLRESNSMRVSRGIRDVAYRAMQVREEIEQQGKAAKIDDIAVVLGLPSSEVSYCMDSVNEPVSLFEPVFNDGNEAIFFMDQLADKSESEEIWTENVSLSQAIGKLSEKELNILKKRYYEGKTQIEVSNEVGISQAQVSRLEKNAVEHLRENM
ncbi:MAG TPA: sigma-70 family RNA polymerase sigma factor [Eubacteriales bacterium]|nr:sigma-70 family RNA polymerase sigma factor [Eubacteriales bacterium]